MKFIIYHALCNIINYIIQICVQTSDINFYTNNYINVKYRQLNGRCLEFKQIKGLKNWPTKCKRLYLENFRDFTNNNIITGEITTEKTSSFMQNYLC